MAHPKTPCADASSVEAPETQVTSRPSRTEKYTVPKLVLREGEVAAMTGLSPSSIRNRNNPNSEFFDPEFPMPVSLGNGKRRAAIGWYRSEVENWALTRPRVHQVRKRPCGVCPSGSLPPDGVSWRL